MRKYLGIEFGSTRIKGVLIDENHQIIASGFFAWENQLVNGVWTYSMDLAKKGLQECYHTLKTDYQNKYQEKLTYIDVIGISGMMHGYLVFDKNDKQIKEFRTWRNTMTEQASDILTNKFNFHIPQRWSIAHIYQAILNKESGVRDIAFATTLAGYFHYLLTDSKVVGIGEASGIFPIDSSTNDYSEEKLHIFNELVKQEVDWKIKDILPKVLLAGEKAGHLSKKGSLLLDEEGDLLPGSLFCPPEGDMGTGMVCTNTVAEGFGNISIGTSSNLTIITNKDIALYKQIDVITTPEGKNAALVHVNNGTSEINYWEKIFKEVASHFAKDVNDKDLYELLFKSALYNNGKIKGIYPVNYFSGEPVTNFNQGKPLLIREADAEDNLSNFMLSQIYSLLATNRIGLDILRDKEGIKLNKIIGHGGFFKTPMVGELTLSASLNCLAATLPSAGEGGPYGEAILAAYLLQKSEGESLQHYLENKVFANQEQKEYMAPKEYIDGFEEFLINYKKALKVEEAAIKSFDDKKSPMEELKQEVFKANLRLKQEGLVTLTWGNVSMIDREKGIVVIKPSGVPYEDMKASDMVAVNLNGEVVEGTLKPSSDTPTHIELYKAFPNIKSVVHTHSTFAVGFAQAKKDIPALGTTHADTFYGNVPCTRPLNKEEIENDYELNTGKVIIETFQNLNYESIPGVIVGSHGPFTWGKSIKEAVDHAVILEEVAKMAVISEVVDPDLDRVDQYLLDKHYNRKHGKNAYYGQKKE